VNTDDVLARFRAEMSDEVKPYLWSDSLVYQYINEAQKSFCRFTNGILDSRTVAVTQLNVVPNTQWYDLNKSILKIRTATRSDTGVTVEMVNPERLADASIRFDGRVGPLRALVQGLEEHAVRAWPVPSETVTVNLTVFRLPLIDLTEDGDQEFEIDVQHHSYLLLWVKHLAYDKQDAETFDRRKSDDFAQRFRLYCSDVKKEQDRARRVGMAVSYGGI